jgi:hypothetical protein
VDLVAVELAEDGEAHFARADQERLACDLDHIERPTRLERDPRDHGEQPVRVPRCTEVATCEPDDHEREHADPDEDDQGCREQLTVGPA